MSLTLKTLADKFAAKLAESGLSPKDARKLGLTPLLAPPPEILHPRSGFLIPYYDPAGLPVPFFRYRYLEDLYLAAAPKKLVRYTQPAGAAPRVYFPPLVNWAALLAASPAAEHPVVITEGELKAACATRFGFACLALGGVWNFKSSSETCILDLRNIEWRGRTVYIAYDSDAAANFQVVAAENALAAELLERGAEVVIVRLPTLKEGAKTGLDDFLVARGADELEKLILTMEPWAKSKVLHDFNARFAFVHNPGFVVDVNSGQRMMRGDFETIYANVRWERVTAGKKGERTEKRPVTRDWLEWPLRSEVRRLTYAPGEPRVTPEGDYNLWTGWGMNGTTVRPGNLNLWKKLTEFLFKDEEPPALEWFERWLAYPLQFPGAKLMTGTVMWGVRQGTGKTLVGYTMKRFYGNNFSEISEQLLQASFNDWAEGKQFIMGDEIGGSDKRISSDRIKSLITQESVTVNTKFMKVYTVPACANYYFTSNHPDTIFLEDTDRRYFVIDVRGAPLGDEFYRAYDAWYRSDAVGALFHYLLHLDLADFNPMAKAPLTRAKMEMIRMGKSELGAWVADLKEHPERIPFSLMTSAELYALYDPVREKRAKAEGLGRELKRSGFEHANFGNNVPTKHGPQRLWVLKDNERLLKIKEPRKLAEIYDRERSAGLPEKGAL